MVTLVLGGARSGKSDVAERMASRLAAGGTVTYVATMATAGPDGASDPDIEARVAAHRQRRPADWSTVEAGSELASVLANLTGVVIVDSLGPWVAGSEDFTVDADALCLALAERSGPTVVVSEEVGLGVHPSSEAGRKFRDALGMLNQRVAAQAESVLLVVAGRVLEL